MSTRTTGARLSFTAARSEEQRGFHATSEPDRLLRLGLRLALDGTVTRGNDEKQSRALHGLTRALIANMVIGVSEGYEKILQLIGVGYSAEKKGKNIIFSLGFSHQILFEAPEGIEFEIQKPDQVEKAQFRAIQSRIFIRGISKQLVGQVTANIRALKPPEPYKGKGIRIQGEYVRKKAGKQVATTAA